MTDCIKSLLNNCRHLKDFFVINHIKRYFFNYLQGQRLKYLSEKFTKKIMHVFRKHT